MIAVYDSGLGGILSLNKIIKDYPDEKILYFGDSHNAPYGNKTFKEISELVEKNITMLENVGVNDLVLACNTICSIVDFDKKRRLNLYDIISKTIEQIDIDKQANILVFGTMITIEAGRYVEELHKRGYHNISTHHLDKLAGYIENFENPSVIKNYLYDEFYKINARPDLIILACTHYPVVEDIFKVFYEVPVFNSRDLHFEINKRHEGHEVLIYMDKNEKLIKFLDKYLEYPYKFYEKNNSGF